MIQASHVLKKLECLCFAGEEKEILVNHCLLLARYYIFSCKYKDTKPSVSEYIYQIKSNLKMGGKANLSYNRNAESIQSEVAQNTSVTVTT